MTEKNCNCITPRDYMFIYLVSLVKKQQKNFFSVFSCPHSCLAEVESRTQGQGRKKKSEAKNSLSVNRLSRGQEQECSKPRTKDTAASVLQ